MIHTLLNMIRNVKLIMINIIMAYGTTVKFTNRTRTTLKLFFVKFPTVKYNIRENTNREIIINICYMGIFYVYILIT